MTEFFFPQVSVSSWAEECFEVCFRDNQDNDDAYLLIQRQFDDDDRGYVYLECPQPALCGHFRIRHAQLEREVLSLEVIRGPVETVRIRFLAGDALYEELKQTLSIMMPAGVFHILP